jgi:hypothetical protein
LLISPGSTSGRVHLVAKSTYDLSDPVINLLYIVLAKESGMRKSP